MTDNYPRYYFLLFVLSVVIIFSFVLVIDDSSKTVTFQSGDMLTGFAVAPPGGIAIGCYDSDNVKDYAVTGKVTYSSDGNNYCVFPDICVGNILKEYYCYKGTVRYIYYSCGTRGCSSTKCN